jgi:hypothetical protein
VTAPFIRVRGLVKLGPIFSMRSWHAITDPASAGYDPTLAPVLLYELFLQITLLVFSILLIVLFFQKRRTFKVALIVYLSIQFLGQALDQGLVPTRKSNAITTNVRSAAVPSVIQTLVPLVLWGLYMARSKRVKLTFVR